MLRLPKTPYEQALFSVSWWAPIIGDPRGYTLAPKRKTGRYYAQSFVCCFIYGFLGSDYYGC